LWERGPGARGCLVLVFWNYLARTPPSDHNAAAMILNPPSGLDQITSVFGSIDEPFFESTHIVSFTPPYQLFYNTKPVKTARCHRLAVDNFVKALKSVDDAGLADTFQEFNGIYNRRPIRGQSAHPSAHSWGIAIDMGASTHPLGSMKTWPKDILDAFASSGFFWGGLFHSRKDPMHFQLATHY
jgi:hypothetical protein